MELQDFITLVNKKRSDVGISFNRSNPIPLDANSVFTSYVDLESYAGGNPPKGYLNNAHPGQVVAVVTEENTDAYFLVYDATAQNHLTPVKLQILLQGDTDSVVIDDTTIKLSGFDKAADKSLPCKEGGKIVWKSVSSLIDEPLAGLKKTIDNEIGPKIEEIEDQLGQYGEGEESGTGIRADLQAVYGHLTTVYNNLKDNIDKALGANTGDEGTGEGIYGALEALKAGLETESEERIESDNGLDSRIKTLEEDKTNREQNLYPGLQQRLEAVETALKDASNALINVVDLKNAIEDESTGIVKRLSDLETSLTGPTGVSKRLSDLETYINGEGEGSLQAELADITEHTSDSDIHFTKDSMLEYVCEFLQGCKITIDGNL